MYSRTQRLFKKRQEATKAFINKSQNPPPPPPALRFVLPKFKNRPIDFRSAGQPWRDRIYRPPTWLNSISSPASESRTSRASSSFKASSRTKVSRVSEPQVQAPWPPPKDSHCSTVPNSAPRRESVVADSPVLVSEDESRPNKLKFVKCDKCGKKNLSSIKQLKVHQQSKKCKNRQERQSELRCSVCQVLFDTRHNLRSHVCRK